MQRSRSLPFRTSPNVKHTRLFSQSPRNRPTPLFTQTITPADSSEEENSPPFASSHEPRPQSFQLTVSSTLHNAQSPDLDMDMGDSQPAASSPRRWLPHPLTPSPNASPRSLFPQQGTCKASSDTVQLGRLPTPIYGYFQQSVDARMDLDGGLGSTESRSQQEIDYENYVRRRRLPSPISEDEDMDYSTALAGGMMGRLDMNTANQDTPEPIKATQGSVAEKKGPFQRSGRMSFSMGVRASCDMCRMRVPGHSVHIFRT